MVARRGPARLRAPPGQLAATTASLEAAARLAVFEPGDRQTSLITRYRLRVPFKCTRRTKRVRVPYQYVAELVFRARGAVTIYLSRACLVDFPHRMRGREEERDGANDSLHVGRPARKLVERRQARAPSARARRALGVCSVCTTVTFSLSESRPRGPCGGALLGRRVRRAASPRDVLCLPKP